MLKPKTRRNREDSQGKTAAIDDVRKEPTKRLNANVPASVYQELQVKAAQEGRKINELVNQWVNEYLSK
jgi:predicted HicB family RNase H-like nuclease